VYAQSLLTRFSPDEVVNKDNPFKWRPYEGAIILQSVRWYLRYALSYRDLEEMLAERGLSVDHTTIFRWVQA
jgi:IS6 family transposase